MKEEKIITTQGEKIIPVYIEDEMKDSYLSYSMSVIIGRALPDIRDGLKPVHRRILYAMNNLLLSYGKPYKKSARIVGEVIGKYHPHGDIAIYESIVRLVQNFSLRYPLIDGQGNFGSLDGDAAAAMRYTEIRMADITSYMLLDIEKNTVNFIPNFDGSLQEPSILPAAFPNLLVNGSSGIAVGMATNIPPHNLSEVIDGVIEYIENPEITIEELLKIIFGPDFPTGGIILGKEEIKKAYTTGKGIIVLRGKTKIEKVKGSKENIIISEIPYQVNKSFLIERIADVVKNKEIEGILDIRDESDRKGVRIVIELKKGETAQVILNQLFKHTPLQITFGIILLALINNKPKILSLKEMIAYFVEYRKEIITRRTKFDLIRSEERANILEGLKIALKNIDKIIAIIRNSKDIMSARNELISFLELNEKQAQAILEMRLQRLTSLERNKIEEEYLNIIKDINRYKEILTSEKKILNIIQEELVKIKEKYGDERKTQIVDKPEEFKAEDFIAEEDMIITISHAGYIKRLPIDTYRVQKRGGKGVIGMEIKEEDFIEHLFIANTHNYILFFTDRGKCHWLKVHEIPQQGRLSKGKAIINLINIEPNEKIKAFIPISEFDDKHYLIMITQNGIIKKTNLIEYSHPRSSGIKAINLLPNDILIGVYKTIGNQDIIIGTKRGLAIRFNEKDIRSISRVSKGVKGIKLTSGDVVIGMIVVKNEADLLVVTNQGYGKRTSLSEYRIIKRGGKGVITFKTSEKNGYVITLLEVVESDELVLITAQGIVIRIPIKNIRRTGRNTQGVVLIKLAEGDTVIDVARIVEKEEQI